MNTLEVFRASLDTFHTTFHIASLHSYYLCNGSKSQHMKLKSRWNAKKKCRLKCMKKLPSL